MKKVKRANDIKPEAGLRTNAEKLTGRNLARIFTESKESVEIKLDNFPKYIRRQKLTRLLSLYEIFKKIMPVKGSIVECGVHSGFGIMAWANMSAALEPTNLTRRIYGFDTFSGFPSVSKKDKNQYRLVQKKELSSHSYRELKKLITLYDSNRFLGHINKVKLIKGDATKTIPSFIRNHEHIVVSLLFLDFDLYDPTYTALKYFYPRIPKGGIIAFDELDNPIWPGETRALLETVGINVLKIERLEFDPYIGYAVLNNGEK